MSLLLRNPVHLLAAGFGAGLSRHAPGTMGTLVGVALYLVIANTSLPVYVTIWVGLALCGIGICARAARYLGVHDDPSIVFDEVVGFLVTMTGAPTGWYWVVIGFVLFRIFDIWKPWPISYVDARVHGGLGIMADDLLAGIFALGALQGIASMTAHA